MPSVTARLRHNLTVFSSYLPPSFAEALTDPSEGQAVARASVPSTRTEARRVSKEGREAIMQENEQKQSGEDSGPAKTVKELVAQKQKLVGKVDPLQDGTDSAAPGQARGKSFY